MTEKRCDLADSIEALSEDLKSESDFLIRIATAVKNLQDQRDKALTENAAWRKATGRDDPEELDSYLGRGGIDSHFNVLNELLTRSAAERDEARAEVQRLKVQMEHEAKDYTQDDVNQMTNEMITLRKEYEKIAFKRGAEAMREVAALWVNDFCASGKAISIRNLPVPEDKP